MFPQKISHFGKTIKVNRKKVSRKPKDFVALYPGHLVAFDTIERFVDGCRRYIITFEDIYTRYSFAWSTTSHASKAAEEFFELCRQIFPFSFEFVLTDNGSEFKKYFNKAVLKAHLTQYHQDNLYILRRLPFFSKFLLKCQCQHLLTSKGGQKYCRH